MKAFLTRPSNQYKGSFISALRECSGEKVSGFIGHIIKKKGGLDTCLNWLETNFDQYIAMLNELKKGIPPKFYPQHEFWLVTNNSFIGKCNIRDKPIDVPFTLPSNIGFFIRPSQRGKGYGKLIFKLILKRTKDMGYQELVACCDKSNSISRKVLTHVPYKKIRSKEYGKDCFKYNTSITIDF